MHSGEMLLGLKLVQHTVLCEIPRKLVRVTEEPCSPVAGEKDMMTTMMMMIGE